ncbi:MAG: glycosyltransferase family 4 protein [SAR324 cluster bacterium]|nr:glycosyltransferase family 4 protein [SAR324 cluster bacterium]MBL7035570.1 glycosyltransferase family 4 protein [SAR324 cluster bacterium]
MKILIGSNVHWWNAEAAYAATVAQLLEEAGHTVFVLTRPDSLNEKHLRQRGLRLLTHIDLNSNNPFRLFIAYHQLKKFLLEEQIELINPHRSEGFPLFVLAARALRSLSQHNPIPVIRTRGTTRAISQHWLNRKMHKDWTANYITAGKIVAERLLKAVSISKEKIKTIYYPVECPDLTQQPAVDFRSEFGIPLRARVLAVVGRIRPVKGQRILLQSLSQLLEEFPDLTLLIPYRDTAETEPEMLELRSAVSNLKLDAHVRLIPEREDIRQLMQFSDVGVVSSVDSEVICRVAVEFFSAATPVVAFPTGCLPEIIRDGENGFLTKTKSAEALTEALRKILADSELCKRLGHGARLDAETRFNPRKMLTETLEIFEQSLKK